jgi:hypothetical protein
VQEVVQTKLIHALKFAEMAWITTTGLVNTLQEPFMQDALSIAK